MTLPAPPALRPLSLFSNVSWTLASNLLYALCQWGMLLVLTRFGSVEMVGQFAFGLAVTAPVSMFTNLQLRNVQGTDARGQYSFSDYLTLRSLTNLLGFGFIVGLVALIDASWTLASVIVILGVAKMLESTSDIYHGLLQQHESMDRIAKSVMLKGVLSLLGLGVMVYLTQSLVWGVLGIAVVWAGILLFYDLPSLRLLSQATSTRYFPVELPSMRILQLAWMALPLGVVTMLISVNTNLPRYFIEHSVGTRDLGVFAALSYLQMVGITAVNAIGQSASLRMARHALNGDHQSYKRLLTTLCLIGVALGVSGIVVALIGGPGLLTLLYGAEYANAQLLLLLMIAAAFGYIASFLSYALTAARYLRVQTLLLIIVVLVNVIACFWLIPLYGLIGAGIAQIITAALHVVSSLGVLGHVLYTMAAESEF